MDVPVVNNGKNGVSEFRDGVRDAGEEGKSPKTPGRPQTFLKARRKEGGRECQVNKQIN